MNTPYLHIQYNGTVVTVYIGQTFSSCRGRIAPSCLSCPLPALQPRPKMSNLKPFDVMIVKQTLIDYCQTPVQSPSFSFRLGVDFVFPLSQEQEQEQPHQNIAEESILEVLNLTHRLIPSPLLSFPTDINPIRLGGLCVFSYCS